MKLAITLLVLGLAACSNTAAVKLVEDSAAEVCACKDLKCAQEASLKFQKRFEEDFPSAKGTPGDVEKINAATKKKNECMAKLEAGGP